jgi:hypothetical protein
MSFKHRLLGALVVIVPLVAQVSGAARPLEIRGWVPATGAALGEAAEVVLIEGLLVPIAIDIIDVVVRVVPVAGAELVVLDAIVLLAGGSSVLVLPLALEVLVECGSSIPVRAILVLVLPVAVVPFVPLGPGIGRSCSPSTCESLPSARPTHNSHQPRGSPCSCAPSRAAAQCRGPQAAPRGRGSRPPSRG